MIRCSFAAVLLVAIPVVAAAQSSDKAERAREHYTQGESYMRAKVYDLAIKEYKQGYKLAPKAHGFLFNIGLAYEKMGEREKAVEAYEQYLERAPKGNKAPEARARSVALRRALDAEKQPNADRDDEGDSQSRGDPSPTEDPDRQPDIAVREPDELGDDPRSDDLIDPGTSDDRPPGEESDKNWTLVAVGVALVVAGVAADLAPDSGSNGKVDALDFLPIGLYVGGGILVWSGAF